MKLKHHQSIADKRQPDTSFTLTLSNLTQSGTLPKVTAGRHFRSKVIGQKILHIPFSRRMLLRGMLKSIVNTPVLPSKLIHMSADDYQRWRQIQNVRRHYGMKELSMITTTGFPPIFNTS